MAVNSSSAPEASMPPPDPTGAGADELVLHLDLTGSRPDQDRSGFANHGRLLGGATPVRDEGVGHVRFDGVGGRIVVRPSDSLRDLTSVLVVAEVNPSTLGEKRTILEGYLSFAFAVEADGRLAGGVYTGQGWFGIESRPQAVACGRWSQVGFQYDGASRFSLTLDGRVVAARDLPVGPVRGVAWPLGLNLGGWPDADIRMWHGGIRDVKLWRAGPAWPPARQGPWP